MKSRLVRFANIVLFLILSVFLGACSNVSVEEATSENEAAYDSQSNSIKVELKIGDFDEDGGRAVLRPNFDSILSNISKYELTVTGGETSTVKTIDSGIVDGRISSYELSLTVGTEYTIAVKGYAGDDVVVAATKIFTPTLTNRFVVLKPGFTQTGTGVSVNIRVKVPAANVSSGTEKWFVKIQVGDTLSQSKESVNQDNEFTLTIVPGSYDVIFSVFKADSDLPVALGAGEKKSVRKAAKIVVYDNCKENSYVWQNSDGTTMEILDFSGEDFTYKDPAEMLFYVGNDISSISAANSRLGTSYKQLLKFPNMQSAVNFVSNINDEVAEYTIYVNGEIIAAASEFKTADYTDGDDSKTWIKISGDSRPLNITVKGYNGDYSDILNANDDGSKRGRIFTVKKDTGALNVKFEGLVMKNAQVTASASYFGDGAAIISNTAISVDKCKFENNKAKASGGAVKLDNVSETSSFTECEFNNNGFVAGATYGNGSVIYLNESNVNFSMCIFRKNTTDGSTGQGTIYLSDNSTTVFEDCFFVANTAKKGSGIYGGNIALKGECAFTSATLDSGEVLPANKATAAGGACIQNFKSLKSEGLILVLENTGADGGAANILIPDGIKINITGVLKTDDGDSQLGFSCESPVAGSAYTTGYGLYNSDAPSTYFTYDNSSYLAGSSGTGTGLELSVIKLNVLGGSLESWNPSAVKLGLKTESGSEAAGFANNVDTTLYIQNIAADVPVMDADITVTSVSITNMAGMSIVDKSDSHGTKYFSVDTAAKTVTINGGSIAAEDRIPSGQSIMIHIEGTVAGDSLNTVSGNVILTAE